MTGIDMVDSARPELVEGLTTSGLRPHKQQLLDRGMEEFRLDSGYNRYGK